MKKVYIIFTLILLINRPLRAQQFGLFNTNTLFDAFENPAQRAFILDESRSYASNFLLPGFGVNGGNKGDASYALINRASNGDLNTRDIPIGTKFRNKFYGSTNVYLFTFRINPFYQNNKELGFSWQVKADAYADYTNEFLVALRSYSRFVSPISDPFNGTGYGQSYHQFSLNYRVDLDEELAYGFKMGVLSGLTYNHADIDRSSLTVGENKLTVGLTGTYRASFLSTSEIDRKTLLPDFKNPGLAISFGTSYTSPWGVFIMGNIKDLGFIRWNKNSSTVDLNNDQVSVTARKSGNSKDLQRQIVNLVTSKNYHRNFYTATNAKIDFLIGKQFNNYYPNLIISKNLFYPGADVVLVNNVKCEDFTFSFSPAFNMNQFLLFGAQAMYQSANFEFFVGTDNLLNSATIFKDASNTPKGVIGASVYMGIGIKFGSASERPPF